MALIFIAILARIGGDTRGCKVEGGQDNISGRAHYIRTNQVVTVNLFIGFLINPVIQLVYLLGRSGFLTEYKIR